MEVSQKITPEFIQQKYIELIEDSNTFLQKKTHPFSIKNLGVYSSLVGLLVLLLYGVYHYNISSSDIFEGQLTEVSFNNHDVLIETAKGVYYKIDKNKKWLTASDLLVEVKENGICFDAVESSSDLHKGWFKVWVPADRKFELELVDGTKIELNSNSSIEFTNNRSSATHNAILTGEAFFEVTHNSSQPFSIQASEMEITVYGTTFNVSNYQEKQYTSVALLEGSIRVKDIQNQERKIKPGEEATYDKVANLLSVNQADFEEILVWQTNQIRFIKEPLQSITDKIEKWYDLKFVFKDDFLKQMYFTGSFSKDDGIRHFLQMLNYTEGVRYRIENKTIFLSK